MSYLLHELPVVVLDLFVVLRKRKKAGGGTMSLASAQASKRWDGIRSASTVGCARHFFAAGSDPSCRLRGSALLHHSLPCGGEY